MLYFRIQVAERAARVALGAMGADAVTFRVVGIEANGLTLADVEYGTGGPSALRVEIVYSAGALARGRIESLRIVEPSLTLTESADGGIAVQGLPDPAGGDADDAQPGDASTPRTFAAIPNIGRIEIVDGHVSIDLAAIQADMAYSGTLTQSDAGGHVATLSGTIFDTAARKAAFEAEALEIALAPDRLTAKGYVSIVAEDAATAAAGSARAWLDLEATPDSAVAATAIVVEGNGQMGAVAGFSDVRGKVDVEIAADGAVAALSDLNIIDVQAPPAQIALLALAADVRHGAVAASLDAVGDSGSAALTLDIPQGQAHGSLSAIGEVDAALASAIDPSMSARGRVRFDIEASASLADMMADPDLRHVTATASFTAEAPSLTVPPFVDNGSAFGEALLTLSQGALTLTSPGLVIGGVALPPESLAALPPDISRAFRETAFLRLGGAGLSDTEITMALRPDGGANAIGTLGLGLSNPNLALFLDGDATLGLDAEGAIEFLASDRMALRMVDAALGPARVSGQVTLEGLEGAGDRFTAMAEVALSASATAGGYRIDRAEVDLAGPLDITPAAVTMTPNAGGRIQVVGVSGLLVRLLDPLRLTLTADGARSLVYDRARDFLDVDLKFRGFKTRGLLQPGGDAAAFDLALGGAAATVNPDGATIVLSGAAAAFPAYGLALDGGDARISFGGVQAKTGRLTIERIRHIADPPEFEPMRLTLDVTGRGDRLTFAGALIAARDRARLKVNGVHDLASGLGGATFGLGPVVFAPGVLQPRDFAANVTRDIREATGETELSAHIAWTPKGLSDESAKARIAIDKVRTDDITIEAATSDFALSGLFPPRTAGPQRILIGRLDVGVPLTRGILNVNVLSPERIEIEIEQFELFGGDIQAQNILIEPNRQSFATTLSVSGIDLASILAFAEFGELSATGTLAGTIPLRYANGELRVEGGLLETVGGGVLKYRPRALDEALKSADRSTGIAIRALANFAYETIRIHINEIEAEQLRLEIFIKGKSLDVFGGLPIEFNIVIEGPIRQIIQDSFAAPELPPEFKALIKAPDLLPSPPPPKP